MNTCTVGEPYRIEIGGPDGISEGIAFSALSIIMQVDGVDVYNIEAGGEASVTTVVPTWAYIGLGRYGLTFTLESPTSGEASLFVIVADGAEIDFHATIPVKATDVVSSPVIADSTSLTAGLRSRGISAALVSDEDVLTIIGEALGEFSRWRPVIVSDTFETVADQQAYTPTEMGDPALLNVLLCLWNPYSTGDVWDPPWTLEALGAGIGSADFHMPSQAVVAQIKSAAFARNYGGLGWQDTEGGSLNLSPPPESSGCAVYILYTKAHEDTDTITTADRDMFLDLLQSYCDERVAKDFSAAGASRVKTPEYEVEFGATIGLWHSSSKRCRERFIQKAQAGKAAGARS